MQQNSYLKDIYNSVGTIFYSEYKFGKRLKYFDKKNELMALAKSKSFLSLQKEQYKDKRCFIIGNGPSLNNLDLSILKNEFTIGSNYIYKNYEKMGFYPTFFTIVNHLVAEQRIDEINNLTDSIKIFPYFLNYCIKEDEKTFFINSVATKEFSKDITKFISWQSTVTYFNMQLAYYLGFKEVYLIGMDHNYEQPEGKEGDIIHQKEEDINHFDKNYFKGLSWQQADTKAMEEMYIHAKKSFAKDGRTIYNATQGGKLHVFERKEYTTLFQDKTKTANLVAGISQNKKKNLVFIQADNENTVNHTNIFINGNTEVFYAVNRNFNNELSKKDKNIIKAFRHDTKNFASIKGNNTFKINQLNIELLYLIHMFDESKTIFIFEKCSLNHLNLILNLFETYKIETKLLLNIYYFDKNELEDKNKLKRIQEGIKKYKNIELYTDDKNIKEFQDLNIEIKLFKDINPISKDSLTRIDIDMCKLQNDILINELTHEKTLRTTLIKKINKVKIKIKEANIFSLLNPSYYKKLGEDL